MNTIIAVYDTWCSQHSGNGALSQTSLFQPIARCSKRSLSPERTCVKSSCYHHHHRNTVWPSATVSDRGFWPRSLAALLISIIQQFIQQCPWLEIAGEWVTFLTLASKPPNIASSRSGLLKLWFATYKWVLEQSHVGCETLLRSWPALVCPLMASALWHLRYVARKCISAS